MKNMLLIIVLALLDFGLAFSISEVKCYGSDYDVRLSFTFPVYYKPRGEEQKLVYSQGQSRHKRFSVLNGRLRMKDLTEQDNEGLLLFESVGSVKLEIEDCMEPQSNRYGDLFSWKVPSGAEYLEFSQKSSSDFALKPRVIWNRTDTSSGRGRVKRKYFEINNLKQKDSGYYKFRGAEDELIRWKRLKVEESYHHSTHMEGDRLRFLVKFSTMDRILFTPRGSDEILEGQYMNPRMEIQDSYLSFWDLKYDDSGTYEFIDEEGFLALRLELEVDYPPPPVWVYVVGLVIIVLCTVCCCCCVKKCCCKKSSSKRSSPETEAAAPRVFYHDSTQHTQPVIPLLSRDPRAITTDPTTYNSVAGNMNLPQSTQATALGGLGPTSTSMISSSSDSDPKYEFKGTVFASALPLSSDTFIQDVYTSDKLNFL